ncbi:Chloroperoxidase [Thelephora terrestris]|uniref:Chloroperoxidase n=1 Tax=Thelephora terrestris TaxID=56493 RepID=A0A9P6L9K4_9AGAM|nr:Chloroperoxidase [Thelephora terrestris]
MTSAVVNGFSRASSASWGQLKYFVKLLFLFQADFGLALYNVVAPKKAPGKVTACGGSWPKYIPPTDTDSRCSCPALNALANHGIFPRDGRNITFKQLNQTVREYYNFAPTFCWFVPNQIARILGREYATGVFDLSDIDVHNGIEHDASFTRHDSHLMPDQSKPAPDLIEDLLASGTGENGCLTKADIARFSGKRRVEARKTNGQYSLSFSHKLFGSSNGSTLLTHFGGDIETLRPFLLEERLPDGWEPTITDAKGLTLMKFNTTSLPVELMVNEREFSRLE